MSKFRTLEQRLEKLDRSLPRRKTTLEKLTDAELELIVESIHALLRGEPIDPATEAWIGGLIASVGPLDPVVEARKLEATNKRLAAAEGKP
jgi:hypothetical protein